jgi:hypothetical protein
LAGRESAGVYVLNQVGGRTDLTFHPITGRLLQRAATSLRASTAIRTAVTAYRVGAVQPSVASERLVGGLHDGGGFTRCAVHLRA